MRRQQLTEAQISALFDPPTDQRELVRYYTLSAADVAAIRRCRGDHNRLGHALVLCYLRYPGRPLKAGERPPRPLVLFIAAQMEDRSAVFQSVLQTVRLEDIMLTDFATLSPADTLEDALEKAVHCLQDDFPVIRGGDMVGVVSKQKILQTLRSEGNGYVQAVMNRIFDVAQKSESLSSAFRKLSARNLSIIPVVENQQLVGIVTLQNLMHSMALLAETRKLRKAAFES